MLVKVDGVFVEQVVRRHVDAAAEPPVAVISFEIADVGMRSWRKGIGWVDDQRDTRCVERGGGVRQMLGQFGRSRTPHRREVHCRFFDDSRSGDGLAVPPSAFGAGPDVVCKRLRPANGLQDGATALLDPGHNWLYIRTSRRHSLMLPRNLVPASIRLPSVCATQESPGFWRTLAALSRRSSRL